MRTSRTQATVAGSIAGLLLISAVVASAAATAAAATTTTSGDVATVEIDVEQDQSRWALPLDSYLIADPHAVAYGEQLAVQPCLEEAGYAWPVPWQDLTEERFEWLNDAGRTLDQREERGDW